MSHGIPDRIPEPPEHGGECPRCGEDALVENTRERSVDCEACGYHDGFDWDELAERRLGF